MDVNDAEAADAQPLLSDVQHADEDDWLWVPAVRHTQPGVRPATKEVSDRARRVVIDDEDDELGNVCHVAEVAMLRECCRKTEWLGPFWFTSTHTHEDGTVRGILPKEKQALQRLVDGGFFTPTVLSTVVAPWNDEESDLPRLRIYDWAVTNYSKGRPQLLMVRRLDGTAAAVDPCEAYQAELRKRKRRLFDPFRRGCHLFFETDVAVPAVDAIAIGATAEADAVVAAAYDAAADAAAANPNDAAAAVAATAAAEVAAAAGATAEAAAAAYTTAVADADAVGDAAAAVYSAAAVGKPIGKPVHHTTVGQLNFIYFCLDNGIAAFVEQNLQAIREDMAVAMKRRRGDKRAFGDVDEWRAPDSAGSDPRLPQSPPQAYPQAYPQEYPQEHPQAYPNSQAYPQEYPQEYPRAKKRKELTQAPKQLLRAVITETFTIKGCEDSDEEGN